MTVESITGYQRTRSPLPLSQPTCDAAIQLGPLETKIKRLTEISQ